MSIARFQLVRDLLAAVRDLDGPDRVAYLDAACADDTKLRREVESLLAHATQPPEFLESPVRNAGLITEVLAATSPVPESIGRYRVIRTLGEGGMGVVYLAEQTTPVRRRVALKVIKLGMDTKKVIARFQAERQTLALMSHPGIAAILDAGATETGRPYFVMELAEGPTITSYCIERGLDTRERIELFLDVCRAVQHAHQKGIIHRDLKPSNVIVTESPGAPAVKVIDFGIAKAIDVSGPAALTLTAEQQVIGTPAYMSPEQLDGNAATDTRTDVYALGVLLYELLTGAVPFDPGPAGGLSEMQRLIRDVAPTRPSTKVRLATNRPEAERLRLSRRLRGDLDWIVVKALEKDPTRRYDTASALAEDLARHLCDEPVMARPPAAAYRIGKIARRHKGALAAAIAVLTLLTGFAVAMSIAADRNRRLAGRERLLRERADQALMVSQIDQARLHARTGAVGNAEELAWLPHLQDVDETFTRWGLREVYARQPIVATIDVHSESSLLVHACALSPDGTLLATGGSNPAIRLFDGRSLRPVGTLSGHEAEVRSMGFSPTATHMASADIGGRIIIWDVEQRKPTRKIDAHEGVIRTMAFAPDGTRLISGGDDGLVLAWDVATGRRRRVIDTRGEPVIDLAFSADGSSLMVGSGKVIRLYDDPDGPVRIEIAVEGSRRQALAPDGRAVASAAGRTIHIWDARTGTLLRTLSPRDSGFRMLSWSPDGRLLAACGNTMHLYETTGFTPVHVGGGSWGQPAWSPDASLLYVPRGFGVRVWETPGERGVSSLPGADGPAIVATAGSGPFVAAGAADGTVRLWTLPDRRLHRILDAHAGEVGALRFVPGDPDRLVTAGRDGLVRCWSVRTGARVAEFSGYGRGTMRSEPSLDVSPDGRFAVFLARDGAGVVLDLHSGATVATLRHDRPLRSVAWSPAGDLIATTGADRSMRLWSPDGTLLATIRHREGDRLHDQPFRSCVFDDGGRRLASGVWGGTIYVFDIATRQHVATLKGHTRLVVAMAFSPTDPDVLASASADGTLRLWDLRAQRCLLTMEVHDGEPVPSVGFSDGHTLVAGGSRAVVIDLEHHDRHIAGNLEWHLQRSAGVADPQRAQQLRRWAADVWQQPWPRLAPHPD